MRYSTYCSAIVFLGTKPCRDNHRAGAYGVSVRNIKCRRNVFATAISGGETDSFPPFGRGFCALLQLANESEEFFDIVITSVSE